MKFLIAGLGSIGRRHLRNLVSLGVNNIYLYRTHQSTLAEEELVGFPVETDLGAALEQKPDAVIVSNPTALHLSVAIPAARAGCHLLLEKPVSHTMDEVSILRDAVYKNSCQVLVGYHFRFHPGLQKVVELLQEGAIGRPLTVRAHWGEYLPDWHPWEDYRKGYSAMAELGGGVVLTLSHPLDYLAWMFGKVERVYANIGRLGDLELDVEDTAEIILEFSQGTIASLHLDYNQRPPAHWLEVVGNLGTLRWDQADGVARMWRASNSIDWETFPPVSPLQKTRPFERNDLYMAEMKYFIDMVGGEATSACTLEQGIKVLELVLAVRSASDAKQPIELCT
jgi:predicted dehydrogenase